MGFKFGGFVSILENLPNSILCQHSDNYYTHYTLNNGVYGCIHVVAVDMASHAAVSTEGRTCAEVLHILSKGDETGEGRTK